jgi:DNA-binding MarR family transcriptional regulator
MATGRKAARRPEMRPEPDVSLDRALISDSDIPEVPGSRYDLQIFQSLRRIMRAIDIHSRKLKSQYQLTSPQLVCLLAVVDHGPLTATTIAERVYLSASTVVGILDRLEHRGLLVRERDRSDRRVVHVSATDLGRDLAYRAPSPLQDGLARALMKLSESDQATIARSLVRIGDLMEVRDIAAAPVLDTGHLERDVTEEDPSPM